jgi:hypothetical protein
MNNLGTIVPKKRLRVVEINRPWAALGDQLTGDAVTDRKAILNFCSRFGLSERTVLARMKLYGQA